MKKSLPLIALIAALAAGSASAAGTVAGTSISNIATASYTDESGAARCGRAGGLRRPEDRPRVSRFRSAALARRIAATFRDGPSCAAAAR